MIEPGRTNAVPKTLIILCVGLFVMRASAVFYGSYFQKSPVSLITWQEPKPIDKSRRDLLSKPYLYFFSENDSQLHLITAQIFEAMLFQNREVARLIESEFVPIRVKTNEAKQDGISKSLSESFSVYRYPSIFIALPNGKVVHSTSWQSDRMFNAFLSDALLDAVSKAAVEAMKSADWAIACQAYERTSRQQHIRTFSNLNDAIFQSIALRHQKKDAKATEVLEAQRNKNRLPFMTGKNDWPAPCIEYLLGRTSRDQLMKEATDEDSKYAYKASMVHYVCGADLLLRGKKEEAIKDLKIAAMKRSSSYNYPSVFANAELQAIGEKIPAMETKEQDDYVEH